MLIRPCQALSFSFFNFNYIWKKREKRKGEKKFCDVKGGHVTKIQLHEKFCVHAKKRLTFSVKLTDPWSVRLLKTIELYMSPLKERTLW